MPAQPALPASTTHSHSEGKVLCFALSACLFCLAQHKEKEGGRKPVASCRIERMPFLLSFSSSSFSVPSPPPLPPSSLPCPTIAISQLLLRREQGTRKKGGNPGPCENLERKCVCYDTGARPRGAFTLIGRPKRPSSFSEHPWLRKGGDIW